MRKYSINTKQFSVAWKILINHLIFYRWCRLKKSEDCPPVPVPPLRNDPLRSSTVLPYLHSYHYDTSRDNLTNIYFTEHDLQGISYY